MFFFSPLDIFTLETSDSIRVLEYKMERAEIVSQFPQIASHKTEREVMTAPRSDSDQNRLLPTRD